ncbi:hypothetical protein KIS4809_4221 [Bacillus sp. ZZV12-4809]|nr:hypothetical protein KIS4809_4221 [Bacillus sp. ZZV12-4809]
MRPRRRSREGSHSSPRKASARSGNQLAEFINKNNYLCKKALIKKFLNNSYVSCYNFQNY